MCFSVVRSPGRCDAGAEFTALDPHGRHVSLGAMLLSRLPFFRLRYCCLDSTCHFSRELLPGPRRHIREERAESLYHRRVRKNGIAQARVGQAGQHRRLRDGDDLAGLVPIIVKP